MSRTVWSGAAIADLADAIGYIAADNPTAARALLKRVHEAADGLANMPTGRIGRVAETYEKVVARTPYVLMYEVAQGTKTITILRLVHMARNWPADERPI